MKSRSKKAPAKMVPTTPKWLLISAPLALGTALASLLGMSWWNGIVAAPSADPDAPSIQVQVKPGSSSQAIGQELEEIGRASCRERV